jgi:hypothetical protein
VAQPLNPEVDPLPFSASNGDHENGEAYVAPSQNGQAHGVERSLVVRQHEAGALSTYVPAGPGLGTIDAAAPGMSFSQLAHAIRRRWLIAILLGLMAGLPTAAVVWLVTPNNFEVTSTLRVGMPKGGLDGIVSGDTQIYEQYRRTQVGLIRTDLVLGAALHREGILDLPMLQAQKGTPKQFLAEEIFVVAPLGSEMVQIKMRGKDPQQLVRAINKSRRNNRLYVRLARPESGFALQGESFPSPPNAETNMCEPASRLLPTPVAPSCRLAENQSFPAPSEAVKLLDVPGWRDRVRL